MDFRIRKATQKDYEGLNELFTEVDALHRKALPDVFIEPDGPARAKEYIKGIIESENAGLFVAEHNGQIIGFVHAYIQQSPSIPIMVSRRYMVIDNLVVKKEFRRTGVGSSLLRKVHKWGLDKGVIQAELNVWEFNKAAIGFYEKTGYTNISRKMCKPLN